MESLFGQGAEADRLLQFSRSAAERRSRRSKGSEMAAQPGKQAFRWRLLAAAAIGAAAWSGASHAWGNAGHRTVCEIALLNLTPTARAEVDRLLQARPAALAADAKNGQFGTGCTYPDRAVSEGPARRDAEHFINYPRDTASVTLQSGCGRAYECADTAIMRDAAVLRSRLLPDQLRAVALIYLGHFVGDIHQPLHNSFADDRGGNFIQTSGQCSASLHSAWDTCILVQGAFNNVADPPATALQSVAASWSSSVTDAQRAQWLGAAPWQWSKESYEIAIAPGVGYCVMVQATCQYDAARPAFSGSNPRTVVIDAQYQSMAMPIVRQRIIQAGIRLAHLINLALDPAYRFDP
jgi:S1/P1 Nuclease